MGPRKFREILGPTGEGPQVILTHQTVREALTEAIDFMAASDTLLHDALIAASNNEALDVRMSNPNVTFAFARDMKTFAVFMQTRGSYHVLHHIGGRALVIYKENGRLGFALFNKAMTVCFAVDTAELILEFKKVGSAIEQRSTMETILIDMKQLAE